MADTTNGNGKSSPWRISVADVVTMVAMACTAAAIVFRTDRDLALLTQNVQELTLEVCELRAQITGIDANKAVLFCQNRAFTLPFPAGGD
jgi:hypothetical protein